MKNYDRKEARKIAKIMKGPSKTKIYGDSRDLIYAEKGHVPCTMPARQRPGKTYAGGRALRRAQARLASSQKGTLEARAAAGKAGKQSKGENALQMPGAMRP